MLSDHASKSTIKIDKLYEGSKTKLPSVLHKYVATSFREIREKYCLKDDKGKSQISQLKEKIRLKIQTSTKKTSLA